MSKYTKQKSRSPKKYAYTQAQVAEMVGCSISYVKKIRTGKCEINTEMAKKVMAIDAVAAEAHDLIKSSFKQTN